MAFSLMSVSRRTCSAHALALLAALLLAAPLAAQPALLTLGGTGTDGGLSVAVTADGGTVVTGSFQGTVDFDPGPGTTTLTSGGDYDVFVARYASDGMLVSAIHVGGTDTDVGSDVAVDLSGNVVVTGYFQSTVDFDPGPGTMTLTSGVNYDVFVARYTPAGALISALRFGSTLPDIGRSVALDASGNAVVTGSFQSTVDFDPGPGTTNLTSAGGYDAFVARYTPAGALISAFRFGSSGFSSPGSDGGNGVVVDASGNTVVTGYFQDTVDFDPGAGTTILTSAGKDDAFVARYTPAGSLVSVLRFGGTGSDTGNSIAMDASGNAVVTGRFTETVDFDPGPGTVNLTSAGFTNGFVARYAMSGALVSAIRFGTDDAFGTSVAMDGADNAVVTGLFVSNFDSDPATTNLTSAGSVDAFVARYAMSGALVSVIGFGGLSVDAGRGIAVDAGGNAVVTGEFRGTADFDPGVGAETRTSLGDYDVFVARYTPSGALALLPTTGEDVPEAAGVQVSEIAPNPSRGSSRLTVTVERAQPVVVSVYDLLGRRVAVPFDGMVSPEEHVAVDVAGLRPGAYVVHIVGDTFRATRRFVRVQ